MKTTRSTIKQPISCCTSPSGVDSLHPSVSSLAPSNFMSSKASSRPPALHPSTNTFTLPPLDLLVQLRLASAVPVTDLPPPCLLSLLHSSNRVTSHSCFQVFSCRLGSEQETALSIIDPVNIQVELCGSPTYQSSSGLLDAFNVEDIPPLLEVQETSEMMH